MKKDVILEGELARGYRLTRPITVYVELEEEVLHQRTEYIAHSGDRYGWHDVGSTEETAITNYCEWLVEQLEWLSSHEESLAGPYLKNLQC